MISKQTLLDSLKDGALRTEAAKFLDKLALCEKRREAVFTAFLTPVEQVNFEQLIWQAKAEVDYLFYGGSDEAEYKVLAVFPDFMELEVTEFPIRCLCINSSAKNADISHRDVLGSLMGLGFKRDRIGDIWIGEDQIQVLCEAEMASYIEYNLERIGRYRVSCEVKSVEALVVPVVEGEKYFKTVSSLRLDAVLSAGFNLSRGSAQKLIDTERVKVNHLVQSKSGFLLKEGDVISCRGKGRLVIESVDGVSKKDRIKITLSKMS